MDDYVKSFRDLDLIGIRLEDWLEFFKNAHSGKSEEELDEDSPSHHEQTSL